MTRIRRSNHLFLAWRGDHGPHHVHVYKDGLLVVKWNLEDGVAMKGHATSRVRRLIAELMREGKL